MYYKLGIVGYPNKKRKYAVGDKTWKTLLLNKKKFGDRAKHIFAQGGRAGNTSGDLETLSAPSPRELQVVKSNKREVEFDSFSFRNNPFHNFRHCFCVTQMM